jgi:mRNA-degrading endonuclease RelE of RelBE toxin-antitoxin system
MYYLVEITPDDFSDEVSPSAARNARRYRVASTCDNKNRDSAHVLQQIQALNRNNQSKALQAVLYLVKLAQDGQPLSDLLDGKALHQAHTFHSQVSGCTEKVWRYRRGEIRVLFYYGEGKVVLLSGVVVKLADKFSRHDLRTAEKAVNAYLGALAEGALTWVD